MEGEWIGRAFIALYEGLTWIGYGLILPALLWLWNATPANAPFYVKLAPFFLALLLIWAARVALISRPKMAGKIFGAARYASLISLLRAGMLKGGGRVLGRVWGQTISLHGEGHSLVVAAQGAGKTTGLVIPTLLTYAGTVIVTDPKAAIVVQTGRDRERLGRVVVLSPWRETLKADPSFAMDTGDDGFNPLTAVTLTQDGLASARLLASLLLPDMPKQENYWNIEGRQLLEWGMLFLAATQGPENRTLSKLHELVYDLPGLLTIMESYAEGDAGMPGYTILHAGAARFAGMNALRAGPQLAGIFGAATSALNIYARGTALGEHVAMDGLDLADVKSGAVKTLYLICPPHKLIGDDRKWLNLVIAMLCQEIGKPGEATEAVLLVDEFPALGYLPNLCSSLEQFRESGLRAHLMAQNPGQILTVYGEDGLRRFLGACETKQFFRMTDPEQARVVSEWCGQNTVMQATRNADGRISMSPVGVPLVRPDEILRMKRNRQIILKPEMFPIKAAVVPYFKRADWSARVDPNPYRRKGV